MNLQPHPMDPRIGVLNSGAYYAFVHGYHAPETRGTRAQVEAALAAADGVSENATPTKAPGSQARRSSRASLQETTHWDVTLRFEHPAWDEKDGIQYKGIQAQSRAKANWQARQQAYRDGHLYGGKGRVYFSARPAE